MAKGANNNAANNNSMINLIIGVVIIAFIVAGIYATYGKISEGIEDKAITTGEKEPTVEYLANQAGLGIEDYLAQYGLTLNEIITKDTTESDMLDNMTLENYLKYSGGEQTADEVLEGTGLADKATKDTLWKDFLPLVPVASVIGEESFNQIKEQLGLGDDVTADMPYGEFENIVGAAAQAGTAAEESASDDTASEAAPASEGAQAEAVPEAE